MSDQHIILGVHITDRLKNAVEVQKVFTEYGCNIKTRIGLHDGERERVLAERRRPHRVLRDAGRGFRR